MYDSQRSKEAGVEYDFHVLPQNYPVDNKIVLEEHGQCNTAYLMGSQSSKYTVCIWRSTHTTEYLPQSKRLFLNSTIEHKWWHTVLREHVLLKDAQQLTPGKATSYLVIIHKFVKRRDCEDFKSKVRNRGLPSLGYKKKEERRWDMTSTSLWDNTTLPNSFAKASTSRKQVLSIRSLLEAPQRGPYSAPTKLWSNNVISHLRERISWGRWDFS